MTIYIVLCIIISVETKQKEIIYTMTKKEFLENAIKHSGAFHKPRQEFLLKNLDKFTEYVKVDANELYDYTDFSLVALHLLIKNGHEADALKTLDNITGYMNSKFENFCIAVAMGEVQL